MPYLILPPNHYASGWSETHEIRDYDEVTDVAVRYIREKNAAKKQDLLLELVRFFHSYLFKYVSMVISGTVPKTGNSINKDVRFFLRRFIPGGATVTHVALARVARTLNVAFKNQAVDEVYNILVGCLIRALDQYDPDYTKKVQRVVDTIEELEKETGKRYFTLRQVNDKIPEFQASKICQMLIRRGHLKKVQNPDKPKTKFMVKDAWPVEEKLLNGKPIGLPYFISYYFPQYLQQYITNQMGTLEARRNMMQLEHRNPVSLQHEMSGKRTNGELRIPSSEGNLVDAFGNRWVADCSLMQQEQDCGKMTLAWVNTCKDPMFSHLERRERMLLYLLYSKEMTKAQICQALGLKSSQYESFHAEVLTKVRERSRGKAD